MPGLNRVASVSFHVLYMCNCMQITCWNYGAKIVFSHAKLQNCWRSLGLAMLVLGRLLVYRFGSCKAIHNMPLLFVSISYNMSSRLNRSTRELLIAFRNSA